MKTRATKTETDLIRQIDNSMELKGFLKQETRLIAEIADQITAAFKRGNTIFLFGNGGSAADAQHIACELAGKMYLDHDPLPAIALSTNTSSITAIANDFAYEEVFSRQVKGLVKKGDVVIGISTSGESANVLKAMTEAEKRGAVTVAFTANHGRLRFLARYALCVPSTDAPRIQETHITAGHLVCYLVEKAFATAPDRKEEDAPSG